MTIIYNNINDFTRVAWAGIFKVIKTGRWLHARGCDRPIKTKVVR